MIELQDWGNIDYAEAWARQREIVKQVQSEENKNVLVLCEHPSVITIGRAGSDDNVIPKEDFLDKLGINVIHNDRGGDVTLHNPGQLVGYPIFNLNNFKTDLHWFLREIEQVIIDTIAEFNIDGGRMDKLTGVWIEEKRKICAMGLHCSRWVTSHGFALNVKNDLREFDYIVPCGITDKQVTSIEQETGTDVDMEIIKKLIFENFITHFSKNKFGN
jgi:lipoyl(octanoyl) transferase